MSDEDEEMMERGDEPPRVPLWPSDAEWIKAREQDARLREMIRAHHDWWKQHNKVRL